MSDNQKNTDSNWFVELINSTFHQIFSETLKLEFEKLSDSDQNLFIESFVENLSQQSLWLFDIANLAEGFETKFTDDKKTFHLSFKLIETKR